MHKFDEILAGLEEQVYIVIRCMYLVPQLIDNIAAQLSSWLRPNSQYVLMLSTYLFSLPPFGPCFCLAVSSGDVVEVEHRLPGAGWPRLCRRDSDQHWLQLYTKLEDCR